MQGKLRRRGDKRSNIAGADVNYSPSVSVEATLRSPKWCKLAGKLGGRTGQVQQFNLRFPASVFRVKRLSAFVKLDESVAEHSKVIPQSWPWWAARELRRNADCDRDVIFLTTPPSRSRFSQLQDGVCPVGTPDRSSLIHCYPVASFVLSPGSRPGYAKGKWLHLAVLLSR